MKLHAIGGYGLVGRNMSVYEFEKEAVAVDIGLHMDNYISYMEAEPNGTPDKSMLQKIGAVPDLKPIRSIMHKIRAIVITHGHLDHVGAVQFLEREFDCPIIATPLTMSILRALAKDHKIRLKNRLITIKQGAKYKVSEDLTIEFIKAAHSIPETSIIAFHTSKGVYLHASDFKFDDNPGVGSKTDVKRLSELKGKVRLVTIDTLNADEVRKTPSESVAKEMLKDLLLHKELEGKGIIVSTFSSHLARLRAIYALGHKLNRKIVFVGRSLEKYIRSGQDTNLISFDNAEVIGYSRRIRRKLKDIEKEGKHKYLIVATGHQGEPGSVLDRISRRDFDFELHDNDAVIFSCSVIPVPQNVKNREALEKSLREGNVRIFRDVHVSGHLSSEDHRYLFELTSPEIIVPTHSDHATAEIIWPIVEKMGYSRDKFKIMSEGENIKID
ncbi:MAG: MBL fold metallo-hydrolase [Candidatus Woesearchaeota archaeon]